MHPKKRLLVAITLLLLIAVGAVWSMFFSGNVFYTPTRNAENRVALLNIYDALQLGESYEHVLNVYWEKATSDLELSVESPNGWVIFTPLEFGATNWYLTIDFHQGKVDTVKIRTEDGPPPQDGPEDKLADNGK